VCLRACVPACLRACVPACLRACVPAWLRASFETGLIDIHDRGVYACMFVTSLARVRTRCYPTLSPYPNISLLQVLAMQSPKQQQLVSAEGSIPDAIRPEAGHEQAPGEVPIPAPNPDVAEVPTPPFDEDTPYGEGHTLKCFYSDCDSSCSTWAGLKAHLHWKHKVNMSAFKGSYFHKQLLKETREAQSKRREKDEKKVIKVEPKPDHKIVTPGADSDQKPLYKLNPHLCWVKCHPDGTIVEPLEVSGLVKHKKDTTQTNINVFFKKPGVDVQPGAASSPPSPAPEIASQVAVPTPDGTLGQVPGPMAMLGFIFQRMRQDAHNEEWQKGIPKVVIRDAYKMVECPPCSSDDPTIRRCEWPANLKQYQVQLPEFHQYLERFKGKGDSPTFKMCLGAGRALGALEVDPKNETSEEIAPSDVRVLLSLSISQQYNEILELKICHPKYHTWATGMMEGLANFCHYNIRELRRRMIGGEKGPLVHWIDTLQSLIDELQAGHHKRCLEFKEVGYRRKAEIDEKALQSFPSLHRIQSECRIAYIKLKILAKHCVDKGSATPQERGLANRWIVGTNHSNTFHGRKHEWEILKEEYMSEVLRNDEDHFGCKEHKTAKCYGEIIKLLTPGVKGGMRTYHSIPRPAQETKLFFVPARPTTKKFNIPWYLKAYNQEHFADCETKPSSNLWRKYYHEKLVELTQDKEKCKEFLVILDGHSRKVIDKHYVFKNPKHDVALANKLVDEILVEPVPWPSDEDVEAFLEEKGTSAEEYINELLSNSDVAEEEEVDDEDEANLRNWPSGQNFGKDFGKVFVQKLDILPLPDLDPKESMLVARQFPAIQNTETAGSGEKRSAPDGVSHASKHTKVDPDPKEPKDNNSKKNKKEKKDRKEKDEQKSKKVKVEPEDEPKTSQFEGINLDDPKYDEQKSEKGRRMPSAGDDVVAAVFEELEIWRATHPTDGDRPTATVWYHLCRAKLIDDGIVCNSYSKDLCRNIVKNETYKKKQEDKNVGGGSC